MKEYHRLLNKVLEQGTFREDRTGTGAYSIFGEQSRYDLQQGFPLLTTKKLHLRSIIYELLWFIRGDTNVKYLQDNGVTIWNEWCSPEGELGPVYGKQWRAWVNHHAAYAEHAEGEFFAAPSTEMTVVHNTIDQLAELIEGIKKNPYGRRHIVSAWNVADIPTMKLPPCHCLFQCFVANGKLSLQLYQRSTECALAA